MSPGEPASACVSRYVRMDAITPNAEVLYANLPECFQARLRKVLLAPIARQRCYLLKGQAGQYRVKRIRFGRKLRATYRDLAQCRCILHVGTHADADDFANHYDGEIPATIIPLEESIMMKTESLVTNGNGHHKTKTAPLASKQELPRELTNEGEFLLQAIALVADKAMEEKKRKILEDVETLNALVLGQDARIDTLAGRQEQFDQSMAQQFVQIGEQMRRLLVDISKGNRETENLGSQVGSITTAIGNRVGAAEETLAGLIKSLGHLEATHQTLTHESHHFDQKLQQCGIELTNLQRWTEERLDRIDAIVTANDARTARLESELRSLVGSLATLQVALSQLPRPERRGLLAALLGFFRRA
jgi:hypothetical protein